MRKVESTNYGCNNRNLAAPYRAGLYPGYVTVSGHVVFENNALHHEVLVNSEQTGFDIESAAVMVRNGDWDGRRHRPA